ncbi:MAG: pyridoxamine 5'-phosphate oxidase family protein [Trueperaceae bacterium]|nr:pyridoxamine 5'-phosphate oxidase family protein [Trueperaceae bacterium]
MAKQYPSISPVLQEFIEAQKIFFVGTAAADGRVNISPKGMDSLRVLSPNKVAWLSVTGSGNETAAHIQELSRLTLMFCAFEGRPMILRLYGQAQVVYPRHARWNELKAKFSDLPGTRQIFELDIDLVQTSCGMSIPFFDYAGERDDLNTWAINKGEKLPDYWAEKNQISIDGKATHIFGD